jgi:hypothetical protein
MIEFGGIMYYIDIDALEEIISPKLEPGKLVETHTKTYLDETGKIVSVEVNESSTERVREVIGKHILADGFQLILDLQIIY